MSNPTYDAAIFADSMSEQPPFDPVIDARTILDVRDSNNGSYSSNDVIFDCKDAGAGSDLFVNYGEGTMLFPITLTMTATGGKFIKASGNRYAMAIKNCVLQLVNSLTVNVNGVELVSRRDLLGVLASYRLMTEWSPADVEASGPSYGFAKDSGDTFQFDDVLGELNNGVTEVARNPSVAATFNEGRYTRSKWAVSSLDTEFAKFQDIATLKTNCYRSTVDSNQDQTITQELNIAIPLKKLHPFFESIPLLCKAHVQMTFNMNVCDTNFGVTAGAITSQTTNQPNRVCPYSVCPASVNGAHGLRIEAAVTNLAVTMRVGNTMMKQCLLRLHRYRLSPDAIGKLMDRGPYTVRYDDYYSRILVNQSTLNNEHINAPVQRPRRLIVIPQTTRAANGTGGIAPIASALSSSPATCQPYWACHQLQVSMSGESIYSAPLSYSYAQWLSEIQGSGSMNGGFSDNLRSGLLTEHDWRTGYSVLDINLARHTKGNDDPAVQIALSLTNQHRFNSDFYCFLVYNREFTISPVTGEITK